MLFKREGGREGRKEGRKEGRGGGDSREAPRLGLGCSKGASRHGLGMDIAHGKEC